MIKIEKVTIFDKTANAMVCNIINYNLNDVCMVSFKLINSYEVKKEIPHYKEYTIMPEEGSTDEPIFVSEYTPIIKVDTVNESIYEGLWQVPVDVIEQWNDSNDIIIESLAAAKGFTIING